MEVQKLLKCKKDLENIQNCNSLTEENIDSIKIVIEFFNEIDAYLSKEDGYLVQMSRDRYIIYNGVCEGSMIVIPAKDLKKAYESINKKT